MGAQEVAPFDRLLLDGRRVEAARQQVDAVLAGQTGEGIGEDPLGSQGRVQEGGATQAGQFMPPHGAQERGQPA